MNVHKSSMLRGLCAIGGIVTVLGVVLKEVVITFHHALRSTVLYERMVKYNHGTASRDYIAKGGLG